LVTANTYRDSKPQAPYSRDRVAKFIIYSKPLVMKSRIFLTIILAAFLLSSTTVKKKHPLLRIDALKDFIEISTGEVLIESQKYPVNGFFIAKYEVTNEQYLEFLQELKDRGDMKALSVAQIKSENWQKINAAFEVEEIYHTRPAFARFPVVNVSYEGAQLYCQWLAGKVKDKIPSGYTVEFRLPDRKEWIRAARGEKNHVYAWNAPYLRNGEGYFLCNFKRLGSELIHFNEQKNTYEIINTYDGPDVTLTSRVGEFPSNLFGIYDMCGNVAEMVAEKGMAVGGSFDSPGYDVRVESKEEYQDASPLIGFRPVMIIKEK
jgi:sulfatase modifying factor 1